ncbi:MAG TPA: PDDEXK nuclease domain-containing protein [Armatimonadota bacterium]|nr:PDDEXK nuclease domain-containing protein [Armatimonadota bacterium]
MTDDPLHPLSAEYGPLLEELKERIRTAQVRAAVSVNGELVLLYWGIGKRILAAQAEQGWGAQVVRKLSQDLTAAFPGMKGFSPRNLDYMRAFARAWPDEAFVQQAAAKLPWFHNCLILDRVKTPELRVWYVQQTLANGWSRNVLAMQIQTRLHERQGAAATNFAATLPAPQSDLARNLLKDPYNFDFLSLGQEAQEREIEHALVEHVRAFLLELGVGFAFLGSQYRLEVAGEEFYLDLLFYHVRLHCYVVIELKGGSFKQEYAGKLNFYLSAVDDLLRTEGDAPSIGLLLCREKNRVLAEYALRDMSKPIGVSSYELTAHLPQEIRTALPTIEELEQELSEPPL